MPEPSASEHFGKLPFYAFLALLAYLVFRVFEPFLTPLGWAAVLVVVFYPLHERLEKRLGETRASLVSTVAVTLILIAPTLAVMAAFVHQGVEAARAFQQAATSGQLNWLNRGWVWAQAHLPGTSSADLETLARRGAEQVAGALAAELGAVLRNVAIFLFDLVVTIFAVFYLFRDGAGVMAGVRGVLPFEEAHRERMIRRAREVIFASVTSSLVVAAVHGVLGGIAFALVGIGAAVFWGVVMAFFALVPLVGAWLIWGPAAIWLAARGQIGRGVALVAICVLAVAAIDNLLRPLLISGRTQLSGLVVFISVLGGIGVFGILGVVLGPMVVATAAGILQVYTGRGADVAVTSPASQSVGKSQDAVLE